MIKNIKQTLLLILCIIIGFVLIFNEFLAYGIIVLAIGILIYLIWDAFIKSKQNQINDLSIENEKLKEENKDLRNRKLNISQIKGILDLGLIEVNTNFTRVWNETEEIEEGKFHFLGALQVSIIAKYGIDLKELRIKIDKNNKVFVANINPQFLSFKDLDYEWKISEFKEFKEPLFSSAHWKTSDKLGTLLDKRKEELRKKVHEEVKNGPEELEWIKEPLKKQITQSLEFVLGLSPGREYVITESFDNSYLTLDQYNQEQT
jgi:hypothetical protein